MEKVRYMISDAANIVNVESHVLRYWEDELELDIPRNELGHRYYTKENINEFQRIKDLKEQGYQLKAIRMIVHNLPPEAAMEEMPQQQPPQAIPVQQPITALQESEQSILANTDKMAQFTELMTQIVGKAIAANNGELSKNISEDVGQQVIKEMNYLMREREEAEEERFRKLDAAIRGNLKKKEPVMKKWQKKKPSHA
uniref:MerR family transcriptional regulator n=1 Tax=Roseburia sp. TaxID=2049040 RepID=UPI003FEF1614